MSEPADVAGLVLAAGEGRRMGRPKALVTTDGTPWLARAVDVLRDAGCAPVVVVLGAASEQARAIAPDDVAVVVAPDFASGASASLRAGLAALGASTAWGALVHLVDLPDVGPDVARRVLGAATGPSTSPVPSPARPGSSGIASRSVTLAPPSRRRRGSPWRTRSSSTSRTAISPPSRRQGGSTAVRPCAS